jgi:predicted anti-sigma-YlaC factor YlaD
MRCSKARSLLTSYLDSELEERRSAEVREHVDACDACRAELAALRSVTSTLGEWAEVEPRLGFDALLARVDRRAAAKPRFELPALPVPRWAAAMLAVASVAGGVLLGTIGTGSTSVGSNKPPTAQQVAVAMDVQPHDLVEASLAYSIGGGLQGSASERGAQ